MMPSIIYETLSASSELINLGISSDRIVESQSEDTRPFNDGYFITIRFGAMLMASVSAMARGPRLCDIAIHHPYEDGNRDYTKITAILNIIDRMLLPLDGQVGQDSARITSVRRMGRSGNLVDDGWKTITRYGTFGVLYNEFDVLTS